MVMRSLVRAVYRFRDATLVAEKKDDFGSALQNLYWELERAENLIGLRCASQLVVGIEPTTDRLNEKIQGHSAQNLVASSMS
jgi:hypothetical protein